MSQPLRLFNITRYLFILASFSGLITAMADQPESNVDQDKESPNGKFVIEMRSADHWGLEGHGTVYEKVDDRKERRWSVDWFANRVELSNSGDHLVRYGPWGTDKENHTEMAVAFYHQGKLLKQYQVRQLIKDPSKLDHSVSHYEWIPQRSSQPTGFSADGRIYHLVLVDKTAYDFDVLTGLIVNTTIDPAAMNHSEIWEAKRKADAERGVAIYNRSPLPALYEPHFTVKQMEAGEGKSVSDFPEPEWRVTLIPKKAFAYPVNIDVIYPRREDETLATVIPPTDFLNAISLAIQHPWVVQKLASDRSCSLRLFAAGSHLSRSKEKIKAFLKDLEIIEPNLANTDDWAEMGVKTPGSYHSFWIHVPDHWLVCQDSDTRQFPPWPYDLLDAHGRVIRHTRKPGVDLPKDKDPFGAPSPPAER